MLTQLVKFKIRSCFDWAQHERILRVRTDLFRIKRGLGRTDFQVDARVLRRGLLDNGYNEIPIGSNHAVFIENLPPIHKDPFDRILVGQASVEGITLLTSDSLVGKYPGPIQLVGP